jgi:hypothetical protein
MSLSNNSKTKTIDINPSLFNVSKTKKHKNKSQTTIPLISPNVLKNKLLKRIKEHKNKETQNIVSNTSLLNDNTELGKYTSEFNDSINYLQSLSNAKKKNDERVNYDNKKARLATQTVKKNYPTNSNNFVPHVNLDLPDELREDPPPIIHINTPQNTPISNKAQDVPYGILKGGNKPTYRQWNKTQKNYVTNPNLALIPENTNSSSNTREKRLEMLKNKIRMKQQQQQQPQIQQPAVIIPQPQLQSQPQSQPLQIQLPIVTEVSLKENHDDENLENIIMTQSLIQKPITKEPEPVTQVQIIPNTVQPTNHNIGGKTKQTIKKTIRKKYTLGKSTIKKTVSVLLKDNATRKQILVAQKDLKSKPVNDIKAYLRQHHLIKIGSNAPNDVVRKMYESAMLAGEITNNNKDIMLHNFIKEDDF